MGIFPPSLSGPHFISEGSTRMLNAYERRLTALYLSNAAARLHHRDPEAAELAEWLERREDRLVFPDRGHHRDDWESASDERLTARGWRRIQEMLRSEHAVPQKAPARTCRRGACGDSAQRSACPARTSTSSNCSLRYQTQPMLERLISDIFSRSRLCGALNLKGTGLAVLLGKTAHTVHGRFADDKPLMRSGLVSIDRDGDPEPARRLHRLVHRTRYRPT